MTDTDPYFCSILSAVILPELASTGNCNLGGACKLVINTDLLAQEQEILREFLDTADIDLYSAV